HRRQAALHLAGRSHYIGPDRRHSGAWRRAVFGVPGAARHTDPTAGTGAPHQASGGSGRAGCAEPPVEDEGVRTPLPGVTPTGPARTRAWRDRGVLPDRVI